MKIPVTPTSSRKKWPKEANRSKYKLYSAIKASVTPVNSLHRAPRNVFY